ncbi:MAG: esterase [Lachnospiraceae bacterium]|nr:esterase [Lachnospiraceae bacterium]
MEVTGYGEAGAEIVLLQPVDERDRVSAGKEAELIRESTGAGFELLAFPVKSWNDELSPWEAPAVFGKNGFGGRASDTLAEILGYCKDRERKYILGGYSLAGLFALWSAYQTGVFCAVAAASPSVWFPGFTEYMDSHEIKTGNVYLSLGDREEKTKNPVMATVGDRIRDAKEILSGRDINCILEWNEGNHFRDPELRTARAFCRAIDELLRTGSRK